MLLLVGFAKVNQHSHNRFIATYFHDAAKDFDAVMYESLDKILFTYKILSDIEGHEW
jgi:hypothetical protein